MIISLLLGFVGAVIFLSAARIASRIETQILAIGLVMAALIYAGFAVISHASPAWLATEGAGIVIYGTCAGLGWRFSSGWLLLGWLFHPVWDLALHFFASGAAFTPAWYALGCVSFDLVVAAYLCGRLLGFMPVTTLNPIQDFEVPND
jgi:hypothetical protein